MKVHFGLYQENFFEFAPLYNATIFGRFFPYLSVLSLGISSNFLVSDYVVQLSSSPQYFSSEKDAASCYYFLFGASKGIFANI